MKPVIDSKKCHVRVKTCKPLKNCPVNAFRYVEDQDSKYGGRMEIDLDRCVECGQCAQICKGHSITMK